MWLSGDKTKAEKKKCIHLDYNFIVGSLAPSLILGDSWESQDSRRHPAPGEAFVLQLEER